MPDLLLAFILTVEKKEENPSRIFSKIDLPSLYVSPADNVRK